MSWECSYVFETWEWIRKGFSYSSIRTCQLVQSEPIFPDLSSISQGVSHFKEYHHHHCYWYYYYYYHHSPIIPHYPPLTIQTPPSYIVFHVIAFLIYPIENSSRTVKWRSRYYRNTIAHGTFNDNTTQRVGRKKLSWLRVPTIDFTTLLRSLRYYLVLADNKKRHFIWSPGLFYMELYVIKCEFRKRRKNGRFR